MTGGVINKIEEVLVKPRIIGQFRVEGTGEQLALPDRHRVAI